ncbi:CidA/LrgA family protein [Marinivivus vitaminiproducens]|uniref:CidA/LrgA family protein n=1 Tax=Marinivivus vitaminiproducens TaxID=3035935 RepID=UPI0027A4B3DE|nr:CidA/LrgA family protein [Geminicoccaceae bacterium SCSIO 64248]
MPSSRFWTRCRHAVDHSRVLQIAFLALVWLAGEAVARHAHLPLPGGIIGMALVLGLLVSGRLRVRSVRRGAEWLLAEMLLFFVPAVLALLDHAEFLSLLGLKLLAVILAGTVCVMGVTALTVDLGYRLANRRHAHG